MKTKFDEWVKQLSSNEIDLIDKLDNMCDSEISEELIELINNNEEKYYPIIESYIKEHVLEYRDFIKSEASKLWMENLSGDICDYSSGLYNCDEIYVRAIANAIGFMCLVN